MKRFLMVAAAMLALTGRGQVAMRALEDIDNVDLVCVTNYGPQVVSLTARVTGLEGSSNDWSKTVSNLAALSNNVSALSSSVDATNAMFSAWFSGLHSRTSYWNTAYSWGDWHAAVAQKLDITSTNGWETGSHALFLTSAPPQSVVSVNGMTGAVVVTEQDPVALAAIAEHAAYWPPDATASSWFTFVTNSGAITITGYNIAGGTAVIIPDYINGLPVTTIGVEGFSPGLDGVAITSIVGGNNLTSIGTSAFFSCVALTSLTAPNLTSIGGNGFAGCAALTSLTVPNITSIGGDGFAGCVALTSLTAPNLTSIGGCAFIGCTALTAVYFDNDAPTIGADIFAGITSNQVTNYVTNPQATGWGATLGDMPVVRLPLHADAITLNGVTHTNWPSADVSGLATTQSVAAVAGAFAGFTNAIPAAGCTALSMTDETNLVVTGETYSYTAQVTTNYWLSIAETAPAYHYSLTVYGTNACTLADNMRLIGTKTETGTNCVAFKPWTNGLWEVMWGGK